MLLGYQVFTSCLLYLFMPVDNLTVHAWVGAFSAITTTSERNPDPEKLLILLVLLLQCPTINQLNVVLPYHASFT